MDDALANSVLLNKKPKHPHDSDTLASESSSSTASTPIEEIVRALLSSKYFFHSPTSILLDRKNEQRQQPETHGKKQEKDTLIQRQNQGQHHQHQCRPRRGGQQSPRQGHRQSNETTPMEMRTLWQGEEWCVLLCRLYFQYSIVLQSHSVLSKRTKDALRDLAGITGQPHCDANDEEFERCKQKYSHMEATYK